MPRQEYDNLTIEREMKTKLKSKYDTLGLEKQGISFTVWITEKLDLVFEKEDFAKRFAPSYQFLMIHENALLIKDEKAHGLAEIMLRNGKLHCSLDKSTNCDHIQYALMLSELGHICKIKPKRE